MHSGSAQMMAMANAGFWPFTYPMKSAYDLSLHPAFLQTAYRSLPTTTQLPYGQMNTTNTQHNNTHTNSPSPTTLKSDKFSIDAILNRDSTAKDNVNTERDTAKAQSDTDRHKYVMEYVKSEKDTMAVDLAVKKRHHKLFESSHPYLSHPASLQETHYTDKHFADKHFADKHFTDKHFTSPYKQFSDSLRQDKCEKQASVTSECWTKAGKGKRVRTIFTPEQLERMEAEFERQQYMVGTERYYLATSLNLTEAQVKVWFQNRRIKWRKQHLEQQQAKLKSLDIYRTAESPSDSESDAEGYRSRDEPEVYRSRDESLLAHAHVSESIMDPFQSPKESRGTQ